MKIKLSDYVWNYIADQGVRHVFMFPGGGAMHLVDSLGKNEKLEYVTLMHEQACTMAAETYARIDYNLGVVLVTTGPGGTNTVTGVAAAWLESTPVIVIAGQAKTSDLKGESGVRQKGNQEIGIVDIVSSITKYAVTVLDANEIKYHLDKAVCKAKKGRPGPVLLDIPLDIQAAIIETDNLAGYQEQEKADTAKMEKTVTEVIDLLRKAKRPVIIAGQGIERNNGKEVFQKLVEKIKIPVLTSWIAVELLEYDHPYNFGKPGMVAARYSNFTMQESDFILAIGTRLDPSMIGYNPYEFAPDAKKVIVDIDQAELDKFLFAVDMKVREEATGFIQELLNQIEYKNVEISCSEWVEQCRRWKKKYPLMLEEFKQGKDIVNPYYFMDTLCNVLDYDDVIIPGSSGAGIDIFWMCLKNQGQQRTLATGSLGSMGYGIPAAIGACLASGKRTICVEGDGSLQLNIQELASIKGMELPIKIFVLNNGGYLSIMNMQRTHFKANFVGANKESHLHIPDITAIAKAYGLHTYLIENHEDMESRIREVLNSEGPALCNIIMRDDIAIQPKVMSKVAADGSMISGTLTDLWPFLDKHELESELGSKVRMV